MAGTRQPNWWDTLDAPAVCPQAMEQSVEDLVRGAADRCGLLVVVQNRSDPGLDLREVERHQRALVQLAQDPTLRTTGRAQVQRILAALDRLDRESWDPQTWDHFRAAETALTAALRLLDDQREAGF